MESDTATLGQPAADDSAALAQPSAETAAGESGAAAASDRDVNAAMNAFMRAGYAEPPTLKPETESASGESAPESGDVKPGESPPRGTDGRFLPRRGAPEAVRTAEQRAEEAERRLAELDPDALRAQIRQEIEAEGRQATERQQLEAVTRNRAEDVERYYRIRDVPDNQLSVEDYDWKQGLLEDLAKFPDVDAFRKAEAQQTVEANNARWRAEITASAQREGVDPEAWKAPGTTWERMARDLCDAREARVRAELQADLDELAAFRNERQQARYTGANGMGALRTGAGLNGRSSSAVALNENEQMNRFFRGF